MKFIFFVLISLFLFGCSVTKRRFNKGWHVEWKSGWNSAGSQKKIEKEKSLVFNRPVGETCDDSIRKSVDHSVLVNVCKVEHNKEFPSEIAENINPVLTPMSTVEGRNHTIPITIKFQDNKLYKPMTRGLSGRGTSGLGLMLLGLFIVVIALSAIVFNPVSTLVGLVGVLLILMVGIIGFIFFIIGLIILSSETHAGKMRERFKGKNRKPSEELEGEGWEDTEFEKGEPLTGSGPKKTPGGKLAAGIFLTVFGVLAALFLPKLALAMLLLGYLAIGFGILLIVLGAIQMKKRKLQPSS